MIQFLPLPTFPAMIPNARAFNLCHQRLWLLPQKALYWQKQKTLLVADLHIGKSGHFRKSGIAVPDQVNKSNLDVLSYLVEETSTEHLVVLGDLFHSNINKEWHQFIDWRKRYRELEVSLVIGNHDILERGNYHAGLINLFKRMVAGPFLFVHDLEQLTDWEAIDEYVLSGHIHPAVKLKGKGRQAMKLPCFYFGQTCGVLPAFGQFTGTQIITPSDQDKVFIIVENQLLPAGKIQA